MNIVKISVTDRERSKQTFIKNTVIGYQQSYRYFFKSIHILNHLLQIRNPTLRLFMYRLYSKIQNRNRWIQSIYQGGYTEKATNWLSTKLKIIFLIAARYMLYKYKISNYKKGTLNFEELRIEKKLKLTSTDYINVATLSPMIAQRSFWFAEQCYTSYVIVWKLSFQVHSSKYE